jgi:CspA family cold shock protein
VNTGTIKFFSDSKGYGFIEVQGAEDVFLHARDLRAPKFGTEPVKGEKVEFELGEGPKGLKAVNVKRVA